MECPYKKPERLICISCQEQYQMPYKYCCLDECGQHEFCKNCEKGTRLCPLSWKK